MFQAVISNVEPTPIKAFQQAFTLCLAIPRVDVEAVAARGPLVFAATPGGAVGSPLALSMSEEGYEHLVGILSSRGAVRSSGEEGYDPGLDPQREQGRLPADMETFLDSFRRFQVEPGPMWHSRGLFPLFRPDTPGSLSPLGRGEIH